MPEDWNELEAILGLAPTPPEPPEPEASIQPDSGYAEERSESFDPTARVPLFLQMSICSIRHEIRGIWRIERGAQDVESGQKVPEFYQECACEWRTNLSPEEKEAEKWQGFDFNTIVELCYCCGAELLRTGRKWCMWFCDECMDRVESLHKKYQRYIIPIGRHSGHGGLLLGGEKLRDPVEREYFATRWREMAEDIEQVRQFAKQVVGGNLELLGFPNDTDIGLKEYLAAVGERRLDKQAAFLRLCKFFEVEL